RRNRWFTSTGSTVDSMVGPSITVVTSLSERFLPATVAGHRALTSGLDRRLLGRDQRGQGLGDLIGIATVSVGVPHRMVAVGGELRDGHAGLIEETEQLDWER